MNKVIILRFCFLTTIVWSIFSCNALNDGVNEFRLLREQAIHEIDVASQSISNGIGEVSDVLNELEKNLPKEIRTITSFDVPFIIKAVAAEASITGLCFIDAAASKALYLLALMKSELITGEPVSLPDPFICHTSVGVIDLNQDRNQRNVVHFTGYNLFLNQQFHAALFSATGDSIPVSASRPTQYGVAVNLSNFNDATLKNFNHMNLYWGNQALSSLFVVKPTQQPPQVKMVAPRRKPSDISVLFADTGYDGVKLKKDCRVWVWVTFGNDRNRAYVEMKVKLDHMNNSGFSRIRSTRSYYYTAPPGWHIKRLTGQANTAYFYYLDKSGEEDIHQIGFGQLRVKAKGSTLGFNTGAVLSFHNDVPDILIEEGA